MAKRKEKKDKLAVRSFEEERKPVFMRPGGLWSEMDRMFDEFKSDFGDLLWPWRHQGNYTTPMIYRRAPPIDVADQGDRYEMNVEMPGIPKDAVTIEVTPTTIEISAKHEESNEDTDKNWLRRERHCTSFYRGLEFPEEVRPDDADAEFKDGVLKVLLPKSEPGPEQKPRKVKVK